MANLIDTNILVYRFDPRDPVKQQIAQQVLRAGEASDALVFAHQTLVEFVAAVTRPRVELGDAPIMEHGDAVIRVEEFLRRFTILWPDEKVLRAALTGAQVYRMSWYDAHLWAYAEVHGVSEILTEDFEHGRYYGSVRIKNPFLQAEGGVHELPEMYAPA